MRKSFLEFCLLAAVSSCVSDAVGPTSDSSAPDTSTPDADQKDNFVPTDSGQDTSTTDAPADVAVEAAPPAPDVIFGTKLVLWLDADLASTITFGDGGTRVAKWADRSTYANDATALYASGTSSIIVEAKAINNRSAMKLTGTWNATGLFEIADKTSLQFGTSDFLVTMIVAYANSPGTDEYGGRGQLWQKTTSGWPYWGITFAANAYSAPLSDGGTGGPDSIIYAGVKSFADGPTSGAWSGKNGWNDALFHAFSFRKDTTNKAVFVRTDGTETQSTKDIDITQNLSGVGANVQIGGYSSGATCCYSPLKGYIAEVIAIKGSMGTTLEINQLKAYINGKYAITL